ncbi:MAG: tRNA (adenosine(37)-N6)-dimethylallyltransferase MiaA [Bacteroidales bacterium]|nr:tRNA (adenosine(37)-N6)-dimethylallyltransferase MiaA [Bacteroidales bacterium]
MSAPTLLVLTGPTASGKTAAAIRWAEQLRTEIVSADSRQLYREMRIGTAAPDEAELRRVPHHFIGNRSIHEPYNVYRYEQEAMDLLQELFQHHDYVILAGGSGLYIDAVCNGIDLLPDPDPALRETLHRMLREDRKEELLHMLKEKDPDYYAIVDQSNPVRLIRALEVCIQTGQSFTSLRKSQQKQRPFRIRKFCLNLPKETLYQRIDERVDRMMRQGLEEEARALYPYRQLNALNTVGYKELFAHFDGQCSLEESVQAIKNNTHHYAKRQITWFKRDTSYQWISPESPFNETDKTEASA